MVTLLKKILKKLLWRNHLICIMTLSGALPPPPLSHPPIAMATYFLYAIVVKFPVLVNTKASQCAMSPHWGAGLAQGGNHNWEVRISHENRIFSRQNNGVETPIPPIMICAAAPDGAPPRRIND